MSEVSNESYNIQDGGRKKRRRSRQKDRIGDLERDNSA